MKLKFENLLPFAILGLILLVVGGGIYFFVIASANRRGNPYEVVSSSVSTQSPRNDDDRDRFTNSMYHFSFAKPKGYHVAELEQDNHHVVVVETSPPGAEGFQILISPFDEADAGITADRVRSETGMEVTEPHSVILNGLDSGSEAGMTTALGFDSNNEVFGGQSTEIWFVHAGHLYQVSGYRDAKAAMEEVIKTWGFE